MTTTNLFVIINFAVLVAQITEINTQGERCYTPNNYYGRCVLLPQCPSLVNYYGQNPNHPTIINFLLTAQRNCGTRRIQQNPLVCCLDSTYYRPQTTTIVQPQPVYRPQPQPQPQPVYRPQPQPQPIPQPTLVEPSPPEVPQTTPQPIIRPNPPTTPSTTETPPSTSISTPILNEKLCQDPNGIQGVCKSIKECPTILDEFLKKNKDPAYVEYIKRSNENCRKVQPLICCPSEDRSIEITGSTVTVEIVETTEAPKKPNVDIQGSLLMPNEGCGFSKVKNTKIVGGQNAKPGSFPWMTLLGYRNSLGEESFKCGGSLITSRHVLTAAHCVRGTLSFVRLGEHNITSNTDGDVQDVEVIRSEPHANYNKKDGTNDIAILYLDHDVEFTNRISPVCLPLTEELLTKNFTHFQPFVAGWGRLQEGGKSSDILQQLQIPVLENSDCKEQYKKQGKLISEAQFGDAILCAGFLNGGKDSCQGDSGGPLMQPIFEKSISTFTYYQIGVVSYGIGCARTDTPGVYTRVQHYIDWIKERVNQ